MTATMTHAVGYAVKRRSRNAPTKPTRAYVFMRDQWTCQTCPTWSITMRPQDCVRRPLGHLLPVPAPGVFLTLDHIVPWALGGNNGHENLQVMCNECNQKKGCAP